MNQKYIDAVKTAHKLCIEMSELDSDEFHNKANEYVKFATDIATDNWHVGAFIMRIALCNDRILLDPTRIPNYKEFVDVIGDNLFAPENNGLTRTHFLTEDLLYLSDIQPDQT